MTSGIQLPARITVSARAVLNSKPHLLDPAMYARNPDKGQQNRNCHKKKDRI
jgi:hypothetical protein